MMLCRGVQLRAKMYFLPCSALAFHFHPGGLRSAVVWTDEAGIAGRCGCRADHGLHGSVPCEPYLVDSGIDGGYGSCSGTGVGTGTGLYRHLRWIMP